MYRLIDFAGNLLSFFFPNYATYLNFSWLGVWPFTSTTLEPIIQVPSGQDISEARGSMPPADTPSPDLSQEYEPCTFSLHIDQPTLKLISTPTVPSRLQATALTQPMFSLYKKLAEDTLAIGCPGTPLVSAFSRVVAKRIDKPKSGESVVDWVKASQGFIDFCRDLPLHGLQYFDEATRFVIYSPRAVTEPETSVLGVPASRKKPGYLRDRNVGLSNIAAPIHETPSSGEPDKLKFPAQTLPFSSRSFKNGASVLPKHDIRAKENVAQPRQRILRPRTLYARPSSSSQTPLPLPRDASELIRRRQERYQTHIDSLRLSRWDMAQTDALLREYGQLSNEVQIHIDKLLAKHQDQTKETERLITTFLANSEADDVGNVDDVVQPKAVSEPLSVQRPYDRSRFSWASRPLSELPSEGKSGPTSDYFNSPNNQILRPSKSPVEVAVSGSWDDLALIAFSSPVLETVPDSDTYSPAGRNYHSIDTGSVATRTLSYVNSSLGRTNYDRLLIGGESETSSYVSSSSLNAMAQTFIPLHARGKALPDPYPNNDPLSQSPPPLRATDVPRIQACNLRANILSERSCSLNIAAEEFVPRIAKERKHARSSCLDVSPTMHNPVPPKPSTISIPTETRLGKDLNPRAGEYIPLSRRLYSQNGPQSVLYTQSLHLPTSDPCTTDFVPHSAHSSHHPHSQGLSLSQSLNPKAPVFVPTCHIRARAALNPNAQAFISQLWYPSILPRVSMSTPVSSASISPIGCKANGPASALWQSPSPKSPQLSESPGLRSPQVWPAKWDFSAMDTIRTSVWRTGRHFGYL